jgi:tetratricopeptide (TPR) repeat protein
MRALVYDEIGDEYHSHLNWGRYNLLRGNRDIAVNEYLNAVQLRADEVDVMFTLADLLTEDGEINHAAEYYEKIIRIEPNNREAIKKLASYRESIGDYRGKVDYLEKLYNTDPNDIEGMKELASGYEKLRQKDKAIEIYKRYLDLVKDPVEYKLAKSKLEKLETFGSGDAEESAGLIDKIMSLFNKG